MRKYLFGIFIMLSYLNCFAQEENDDLLPSGTLPVLYVNTVDNTPVDQKEYYIDATAWFDASMTDEFESIGTPEEPLILGIRGRGNFTWSHSEQKPYKLKFEKKQSLMGFKPSKHFALLHLRGIPTAYFHEPLAFKAANLLGEAWVPSCMPCEVVLNGKYIGLYFLTETVRVEKNRLNITDQPDLAVDKDVVSSGWLVEIDNNLSDNQVELYEPNGRRMLLTFHNPEVLSDVQLDYIKNEFSEIIGRVHDFSGSAGDWLDIVDGHSVARHYILNEIMQNYDGFCGSFFLHKDKDTKWSFGPAWDYGTCLLEHGNASYLKRFSLSTPPCLIREMLHDSDLRNIIIEEWESFYAKGTDWVDEVADDWVERVRIAGDHSSLLWGFSNAMDWRKGNAVKSLKDNMEWFDDYVHSEDFNLWVVSELQTINNSLSDEVYYDLMGRRITSPTRGIYISKGRKFIAGEQ